MDDHARISQDHVREIFVIYDQAEIDIEVQFQFCPFRKKTRP